MTDLLKQTISNPTSQQLQSVLSEIQANALNRDMDHYRNELQRLRIRAHKNRLLYHDAKRSQLCRALANDIANWSCNWDIDLALTLPRSHPAAHAPNPSLLANLLRRYFAGVDARIFPDQSRKHRPKLYRLVVLEHAEGVGWHMHGLVSSPKHSSITNTNHILRGQWYQALGEITDDRMDTRRFYWSDIHQTEYIPYCLKYVIQTNNSEIELSKGTICWRNTVRPQ